MPRDINTGATFPPITGQVTDDAGGVPLGDAETIELVVQIDADSTVEGPCTAVAPDAERGDPDAGKWSYEIQAGGFTTPGQCKAAIRVTWEPGRVQWFPHDDRFEQITIVQALG